MSILSSNWHLIIREERENNLGRESRKWNVFNLMLKLIVKFTLTFSRFLKMIPRR